MTPRVDLCLPVGYGLAPRQLVALCQRSEEAGLYAVCCGELAATEAMSLLGAVAVSTERIALETSVCAVASRSPALYAMAAATLAELSGGRFALGIGAGSPLVARFHGGSFDRPLRTVGRWVEAVRAALDGEALRDWGSFRLRGIQANPVDVLVSAMSDGMVGLAARRADGVVVNFAPEAELGRLALVARKARAESGIDGPFQVHAIAWLYAGNDVENAGQRFRLELAPYLAVPAYRRVAMAIAGEEAVQRAETAFMAGGRAAAAAAFPDSIIDALLVVGSAGDVAARVRAFGDAGCTGVRFTPIADDPADLADNLRAVELLGDVVSELAASQL
jgi:alkanesulfonate monooxygenase SsuD/methylene tetrahydromethanopterin reductase-like flavin-dependent oxidoreductase (luciferase family)